MRDEPFVECLRDEFSSIVAAQASDFASRMLGLGCGDISNERRHCVALMYQVSHPREAREIVDNKH
jgi:hypothetical protein